MTLQIAVLKQIQSDERRVAMMPSPMQRLDNLGVQLRIEAGAGQDADFADAEYVGAQVETDRTALLTKQDEAHGSENI
ncbi:MAG TPA: hypothetical protein VGC62_05790 [Pseudomonas sp.]|uniref:hypothetical protein n=1 Tax=Pseudomonas sp. TaxID=306 RepID=UPI002EDA1BC2